MKRFCYSFLALLAAIVLLASCGSEQGSACLKLIPENAVVVARFDVKKSLEAIGYDKEKDLREKMKQTVKEAVDDKDFAEKICSIIDNPSESGIDTDCPLYLYVSANMSNIVGLVGTPSDRNKMAELLGKLIGDVKLEETDGVSYFDLDQAAIAFTDDWFFVGMAMGGGKSLAKDLKELANASEAPILKNEDFKKMMELEGMAQMLISGKGLNDAISKLAMLGDEGKEIEKAIKKALPGKLEDISILANGNYDKGISTGTTELLTFSDEWKQAVNNFDAILGDIDAKSAALASGEGIAVLANINGEKLYDLVEKAANTFGFNDEDTMSTLKTFISTVTGNICFSMTGFSGNDTPELSAYASTKDAAIINTVSEALGDEDIQKIDDHNYVMNNYNWEWNDITGDLEKTDLVNKAAFGFKDGLTYVVFGKEPVAFQTPAKSVPSNLIKGKGFFCYINYDIFKKIVALANDNAINTQMAVEMCDMMDYVEAHYEGNGLFTMRGEMKDKNASILGAYARMLEYLR